MNFLINPKALLLAISLTTAVSAAPTSASAAGRLHIDLPGISIGVNDRYSHYDVIGLHLVLTTRLIITMYREDKFIKQIINQTIALLLVTLNIIIMGIIAINIKGIIIATSHKQNKNTLPEL